LGETRAAFRPETVIPPDRTVELVWTTGARVRRAGWDEDWLEELSLADGAVDLARLNTGANLLAAHDSWGLDGILGVVEWARIDDVGGGKREGRALVRFSDRLRAQEVFKDVQAGIIRNVSVGYITHELEQVEKGDRKARQLPVYQATRWEPVEVSLCAVPADAGAQVRSAADDHVYPCSVRRIPMADTTTTVEQPTRRKAAVRSTRAEERPPGEQHEPPDDDGEEEGVPPPPAPAPAPDKSEDLAASAAAEERTRIQTLYRKVRAAGLDDAVAERLIAAGTTATQAERAVFAELERNQPRVSRSAVESTHGERVTAIEIPHPSNRPEQRHTIEIVGDGTDRLGAGIIAALLHRTNPGRYARIPEAGAWIGRGMMELGRALCEARGLRTHGLGKMELAAVALGLAHPQFKREGPHGFLATSDLPTLLATVGRATLAAGYAAAPKTYPPWTRQGTLPDFRISNRVSLGLGPKLLPVPEHAEYTRGKLSLVGQPAQLGKWGRILAFTREAMINDDVGLFSRIPQLFGNSAAMVEGDAVYGLLTSNPLMADGFALFSAQHGNLMVADTINVKSVSTARAAMMNQKSPDGQYLSVTPRFMITGPAQEVYMYQFLSPLTIVGAVTSLVPSEYQSFTPIVDPRITDNAWYLAADPNQIDTIEYDYLEGNAGGGPTLETREGWDIDGQEYKARMEFGAAVIDWRGLVKNPGTLPALMEAPVGQSSGGGTTGA
jgi:phage head maturation protease